MPSTLFSYTGAAQTFVVPVGVTLVSIDATGAQGARSETVYSPTLAHGLGTRVRCDLIVTPGETLHVYVGGRGYPEGGWNGGGHFDFAPLAAFFGLSASDVNNNGGGASDVRQSGTALANRVVVAAGGGGGGRDGNTASSTPGGQEFGSSNDSMSFGAATNQDGSNGTLPTVTGGIHATALAGGAAGTGGSANGVAGSLGQGGGVASGLSGGGGGGGLYGGGSGGVDSSAGISWGGGGCGVSLTTGISSTVTSPSRLSGAVRFTWVTPPAVWHIGGPHW